MEVDLRCALLKARDHDENLIEFSMCSRSSMCFRKIAKSEACDTLGGDHIGKFGNMGAPGDSSKRLFE